MKEILTKIPKNLGGTSPVLGVRCEWIATAALLAGGVASSLFGGAKYLVDMAKSLAEMNGKMTILCDRIAAHEARLTHLEDRQVQMPAP